VGQYILDQPEGIGLYKWEDDEYYVGEWKGAKLKGQTKPLMKGVDYKGEYIEGVPNGTGKIIFEDGTVYSGQMDQGQCTGIGEVTYSCGYVCQGQFLEGVPNGKASLRTEKGVFEGDWDKGFFVHGTFTDINGHIFKGEFVNKKLQGQGVKIWPSGKRLEIRWLNGVAEGRGKKIQPDGRVEEVFCYKGKFVKGNIPEWMEDNLENRFLEEMNLVTF